MPKLKCSGSAMWLPKLPKRFFVDSLVADLKDGSPMLQLTIIKNRLIPVRRNKKLENRNKIFCSLFITLDEKMGPLVGGELITDMGSNLFIRF